MKDKQLKVGALLSYSAQIIHILTALLYTPVLLRVLGQNEYGLYQLVYSIISYLPLLSSGFSSSYMKFYAQRKKQDETEVAELNGQFLIMFLFLVIITILSGFGMILKPELVFGKGLATNEIDKLKILVAIMIANTSLNFVFGVFECYSLANERFIFQNTLIVLSNLFSPLLTLPLILLGYGSVGIVAITTLVTFFKLIIEIVFCIRRLKIRFRIRHFGIRDFTEIWSFTVFVFISNIVFQINNTIDSILLGRFIGTASVAIYGVAAQLVSVYKQLCSAISRVFIPRIHILANQDDGHEQLSKVFISVGRIQTYLVGLLFLGMIVFGKQFIRLWAGDGYYDSYQILIILISAEIVPCIQTIGIEIQRAYGRHKIQAIVFALIAILNVLISIPAIRAWGTKGAAVGTSVAIILGYWFFQNYYYHKVIQIRIIEFWKQIFRIVLAWIPCGICGFFVRFVELNRWVSLFGAIILFSLVYVGSIGLIALSPSDKNAVKRFFNKVLGK